MGWRVTFAMSPSSVSCGLLFVPCTQNGRLLWIPECCWRRLDCGSSAGHEVHNEKNEADDEHNVE
jgi:hypothetical protein